METDHTPRSFHKHPPALQSFYSLLLIVVPFACGFNLDTEHPRIFPSPRDGRAFGHQVCQFGPESGDRVLVTDPQRGNGTGGVFRCSYSNGRCEPISVDIEPGSAFGLALACSDRRAVVCGPHLVQKCEGFNYLNGICAEFNPDLTLSQTKLRPAFQECHEILPVDAVILFDDSNSIKTDDFNIMINFIKNVIRAFIKDPRSQVAVAKYSTEASAVFQFENFASNRDADKLMDRVTHSRGNTYTTTAIRFVLENMFLEEVGMRNRSQKLLVVITDGKSNDGGPLSDVIRQVENRGITRFAIGVGNEYSLDELRLIASSPDFVFETESFSALAKILNLLTQRIFAIEGTNVGNSSSIQLELSQGGFSVALSEEVSVFGAVGAYSWAGGLEEQRPLLNASFINASTLQEDMEGSYLGYSVAVATVEGAVVYFTGAPRHKHTGTVLGFSRNPGNEDWVVTHRVNGSQLGSYFGAELCVLDGLLAVGAPLFHAAGVGGEVTIYTITAESLNRYGVLRGVMGSMLGRFGSALAAVQDLNGDGRLELGVGAPQEDKGKGAVYLFLSRPGGIRTKHSQRVGGATVGGGLQYFGVSLDSAGDLSSDGLPDLTVGSKGAAVVLRTHPVTCVNVSITLDPPVIPQNYFHCSAPYTPSTPVNLVVCVDMKDVSRGTIKGLFSAAVLVTMELDSGPRPRLLFSPKSTTSVWNTTVSSASVCNTHPLTIPRCISDYREVPLWGELMVEGESVDGTGGLKPVQNPDCTSSFRHMVLLEKVCGEDHVCVSDLNVSFGFSREMVVNVEGFVVNVTVVVVNNGEDASDTELLFHHPSLFSFTRVTALESSGSVRCGSNQTSIRGVAQTSCRLGVFRQRAKVLLDVSFQVSEASSLSDRLTVNASVTSKNEKPETLHDNSATVSIPVKRLVNIQLENNGSIQFIRYDLNTQLNHTYRVENMGELSIPVHVTFVLPLETSSGLLWDVSHPVIYGGHGVACKQPLKLNKDESLHTQHCNNFSCRLIGCSIQQLAVNQSVIFHFSGNVKSQSKVSGLQVSVESRGLVSFDEQLYTQYLNEEALQLSIVTEVDSPSQAQTVLIACLSIVFGLIAMAVLFYLLYKQGALGAAPPGDEDVSTTPADCWTTETGTSDGPGDETGEAAAASESTT
ncbi:integrin alpha-X-like isoform X2 [Astyanax mexicanus]|uniref:integrin alpha-X-like isoform X2 n=1 Tax=Astyanax mexicanus TaxID=7994 RepID=UPI0020CAF6AE|nr:integrin alpha-X-like isoform X2 [Astyanax mexicanus]